MLPALTCLAVDIVEVLCDGAAEEGSGWPRCCGTLACLEEQRSVIGRLRQSASPSLFRLRFPSLCATFGGPSLPRRTVVDVAAWLRDLGLERYKLTFRENEIDWDVLPELTESDLERLGLPLGPRKKLLKAIAALATEAIGVALEAVPSPGTTTREAERRQLTVLFCDLVGSTELSARLDPEDLREVIGKYQDACAEVIERFEGHVARFLGDGALAYFGWPRAHEHAAERAVRAGLALVEVIAQLEPGMQARVGVATGSVVVGDLIGRKSADLDSVIGETPNLAARLQMLAEPGTVVIGEATRRLVGGLFELDDLGSQRLKGFAEPLAVWRVASESRADGRFEAMHAAGLTPLVGRDQELWLLLRRWELAKGGEGQVVLLSGSPGSASHGWSENCAGGWGKTFT